MSWKTAQERNRRLAKLYNLTKTYYGRGVWLDDNDIYKRYYISGHGKRITMLNGQKINREKNLEDLM